MASGDSRNAALVYGAALEYFTVARWLLMFNLNLNLNSD